MPIHCPVTLPHLDREAFDRLDYRVMGHAFASQNELGRLCEESAYEADLQARLLADGFHSVQTQVPITVSHRNFAKRYAMDLEADGALYELKADAGLTGEHEAQLFNYMFLTGVPCGKLINFRPVKVQGKLLATPLTPESRRKFTTDFKKWNDVTPACGVLRQTLLGLLEDWGMFLDLALYQEALIFFLGGPGAIERQVRLSRKQVSLGSQKMFVHAPGVAFRLTALVDERNDIEPHLRRLLTLTELKAIQWINLNHNQIVLTTITR